jgi:hypothetical protein
MKALDSELLRETVAIDKITRNNSHLPARGENRQPPGRETSLRTLPDRPFS